MVKFQGRGIFFKRDIQPRGSIVTTLVLTVTPRLNLTLTFIPNPRNLIIVRGINLQTNLNPGRGGNNSTYAFVSRI